MCVRSYDKAISRDESSTTRGLLTPDQMRFYCPYLHKEVDHKLCEEFEDCLDCIEWHIYNDQDVANFFLSIDKP